VSLSKYPPGVSDSHPYFNPVERELELECGAEEIEVVPLAFVKDGLSALQDLRKRYEKAVEREDWGVVVRLNKQLETALTILQGQLELYKIADAEVVCEFKGEVEAQIVDAGCVAVWTCPVCGAENQSDRPGDGRDDDDDYDRRRDEAMEERE
jgi:hypothetical protein